jgi:protein phosphatase
MQPINIKYHGATDAGQRRRDNEDQFLCADLDHPSRVKQSSISIENQTQLPTLGRGDLFVVADGMGGHVHGAKASEVALRVFLSHADRLPWSEDGPISTEGLIETHLKDGLTRCQNALDGEARADPSHHGMGTTLTAAYLRWPKLYVAHAGDSRCYLQRGKHLSQVTHDHTVLQQMLDAGIVQDESEANAERFSNVLANAIVAQGNAPVKPEAHEVDLAPGDKVVLCTDGLTDEVSERQIETAVSHARSPEQACEQLVNAANQAGGDDNITVVVVDCVG